MMRSSKVRNAPKMEEEKLLYMKHLTKKNNNNNILKCTVKLRWATLRITNRLPANVKTGSSNVQSNRRLTNSFQFICRYSSCKWTIYSLGHWRRKTSNRNPHLAYKYLRRLPKITFPLNFSSFHTGQNQHFSNGESGTLQHSVSCK